jgi:CRISPR-associated protein Csm1
MTQKINEREFLILGALLHDIGKFFQRAFNDESVLSPQSKNMEGIICPNEPKIHRHVLWTNEFFEKFLDQLSDAANLASFHHKPENKLQKIVQLADWISSGERIETEDVEESNSYETPIISIFSSVNFADELPQKDEIRYLPLEKYKFSTEFEPKKELKLTHNDYKNLWDEFISDVKFLKNNENKKMITDYKTWLYLLMKYCIRIPSATPTKVKLYLPDISLFDHLKTTAAIAVCLYDNDIEESDLDKILANFGKDDEILNMKYFALIKGDISGIQKFLYTITSKGAASTLKGRSFFLQLLSEIIAKKILDHLNLPETNLLYNGGGHFYILSPNIKTKEKISTVKEDIEKILFRYFNGKLGFLIDYEEIGINDFCTYGYGNPFSFAWGKVSKKLDCQKNVKFINLLVNTSEYENLWEPLGVGGKIQQCEVCKAELKNGEENICSLCESFEILGKKLRNAEYILVRRSQLKKEEERKSWFSIISHFGYEVLVYSSEEKSEIARQDYDEIILLNTTNFQEKLKDIYNNKMGINISIKFRSFGISTPMKNNEKIKTFEDLGESSDNKIGILRADVDNLGDIFQRGLGKRATISRISTLSNSLQYFFEGWLSKFLEKEYKNDIYLIYSGGDDLLLVGSWNKIVNAAYKIRENFEKYVCYNKNFGLSCGIVITDDKFPIYRSAELAGKAERYSKQYSRDSKTKDAVTIFDITVGWEEFKTFQTIWDKLYSGIKVGKDGKKMPQAILRKLFMISYLYEKEKEFLEKIVQSREEIEKLVQYTKWRWYLVYTIARSKDETFKSDLEELQKLVIDEKIISRLRLPLRLAELSLRIKGGE